MIRARRGEIGLLAALARCVIEWHTGYCDPDGSIEYQHTSFVGLKSVQLSDVCTIGIVEGLEAAQYHVQMRSLH